MGRDPAPTALTREMFEKLTRLLPRPPGGDPGRDLFVSPGDPAFYTHHSQIDRVWTLWQWLDLESRQNALAGTGTFLDSPPSPNTTLDTLVDLGYAAGEPTRVGDLMSNIGGKFCYLYA